MTNLLTPGYHESGTKWHLAPNFTEIALSEEDTIQYAIGVVLNAKNKHLSHSHKAILVQNVESFVNGTTIKYLNRLTDTQWNELDCIPLICKVYLRHLLAQSFKYKSKQQLLEYDFNWGINIDFNQLGIRQKIDNMLQLGFEYDLCCEAIIVTDNKSLDEALNYALLDDKTRQKEYISMKTKLNRAKIRTLRDIDYVHYIHKFNRKTEQTIDAYVVEGDLVQKWHVLCANNNDIFKEIEKCKLLAAQLKTQRLQLAHKLSTNILNNKLILYENYVKGILAAKRLNVDQITQWKKYRNDHDINNDEHLSILKKFGYENEDALDAIKTYISVKHQDVNTNSDSQLLTDSTTKAAVNTYATANSSSNRGSECVICWSSMKGDTSYMLVPCNHICLCEECALTHYAPPHNDQKCPLDCQKVVDVKKVYFS